MNNQSAGQTRRPSKGLRTSAGAAFETGSKMRGKRGSEWRKMEVPEAA